VVDMVGVSPDRVMLIKAAMAGGRSVGSGTLVAPSLVLTAAHVVFDDDGRPATRVEVGGANAAPVGARVVWPSTYAVDDNGVSGRLDAALVKITETSWVPPQLPLLRWGRLTGRRPGVACEATGFPRALTGPQGVRDTDQVSGEINPGSRRVAGRYDLAVTSPVPTPLRDKPSPWGGLSGAGVFANGLLVAVIIVDERGSYSGDRLSAVPVHRLASDAQFTAMVSAAGSGLTGPAQLESVELEGVLTPLHRRASRRGDRAEGSLAMLLRPELGVVPFHGRDQLTTTLIRWCQDRALDVGVRLLTGSGGQGKTRMAHHLAEHLLQRPLRIGDTASWVCGFLHADPDLQDLAVLADTDAPLLILVDYAETRSQQLRRLLPLLWEADTSYPMRVLLLARAAGEWWAGLTRDLDGEPGEVISLGALDPVQDRTAEFAAAVAAFHQHLEDSALPDARREACSVRPPADIGHDRYGTPLTLQLAALTALLETRQPLVDATAGGGQPEDTLLRHEERYWIDSAHSAGLDVSTTTLRRLVATATLCGAGSFADASALASAVPGSSDLTQDQLHRLDSWLGGLYPPDSGQRWGSLQPDRLGEYLIATTLPEVPGLLSALLSPTDAARHHRALTMLARVLGNPALTEPTASRLLIEVRDALAGDLARLAPVALQVITETAHPGWMLAALRGAADTADVVVNAQLVDALPQYSVSLADLAAQWTARRVAYLRTRAGGAAAAEISWWRVLSRPRRCAELATSLIDLSVRLADLGRREEAHAAGTEATHIYGRLRGVRPNAFKADLAVSLYTQSIRLAELGQREQALGIVNTAIAALWALQNTRFGGYRPWWFMLVGLGPMGGASPPPDWFLPSLAGAQSTQSILLAELGHYEEALAAITQAVTAYRWLAWWFAAARPGGFAPSLAGALSTQSVRLAELGRYEEALAAITEAVSIRRWLAAGRPDAFGPALATALNNQFVRLAELGRYEEALAAITEAVDTYRALAAQHAVFVPRVAHTLGVQCFMHGRLGDSEGAASAGREAVSIYAALVSADSDRYRDDYEQAIQSLTHRLEALGRTGQEITEELDRLRPQGD
jgi:tetratricopeptide (TPR) repeat protein